MEGMSLKARLPVMSITVGGRTADQFSGQTYFFFAPLFFATIGLQVNFLANFDLLLIVIGPAVLGLLWLLSAGLLAVRLGVEHRRALRLAESGVPHEAWRASASRVATGLGLAGRVRVRVSGNRRPPRRNSPPVFRRFRGPLPRPSNRRPPSPSGKRPSRGWT